MLRQIRYHRARGARRYAYLCIGDALFKPKVLKPGMLDIRDEHLAFLQGKRPATFLEKRIHALLIHENTHSERQIASGVWWHQLRYAFSKSFRLREEQAAYAAEIRQLVRYQLRVRRAYIAGVMSGPLYRSCFRRMVSYKEALQWVQDTVRASEIEFFADCMASDDESPEQTASDEATATDVAKIAARKMRSVTRDRIALVCTALVSFVVLQVLVLGVGFLAGRLSGTH